jgi:acetylglutamate kinase
MTDVDDPASLVAAISTSDLEAMIADGTVTGGMIPKAQACIAAVTAGARSAHMLDGRVPHVLLLELFTDSGIGTMVTKEGP